MVDIVYSVLMLNILSHPFSCYTRELLEKLALTEEKLGSSLHAKRVFNEAVSAGIVCLPVAGPSSW